VDFYDALMLRYVPPGETLASMLAINNDQERLNNFQETYTGVSSEAYAGTLMTTILQQLQLVLSCKALPGDGCNPDLNISWTVPTRWRRRPFSKLPNNIPTRPKQTLFSKTSWRG
jgi:hypothetical protein